MKKILMVLTSHEEMEDTDRKTGVWIGEFTGPYYEFIDAGYWVTVASPKGGEPPIDPMSEFTVNITASNRRFQSDSAAQHAFKNTLSLQNLTAEDFDAVFYPGGHGPLWDLAEHEISGRLILDFYNSGKPVALVCHGPAALIKAAGLQPGLLKNKQVTAFTNTEETISGTSGNIPYELETRLTALGAKMHAAMIPFAPHIETDGLLLTGQNPLSADRLAKTLVAVLEKEPALQTPEIV
jgi:putative intracellular protease/amidase